MATLARSIASDADDGQDTGSAWIPRQYGGQTSFEISDRGVNVVQGGLRFTNITIGQGETINDPTEISLVMEGISPATAFNITVYGDDVDTAPAFSGSSRPTSGWTDTTASTTFSSGTTATTLVVDVKDIVQEIVNRIGWSSGNAIRFRFEADPAETYRGITVEDLHAGTTEASISIDYGTSGTTTPQGLQGLGNGLNPQRSQRLNGELQ